MANFCSNCGTALDPTQKFCSECGTAAISATSKKAESGVTFPAFSDWSELYNSQRLTPNQSMSSLTDTPWFEEAGTFAGNCKVSDEFQLLWLADQDELFSNFDENSKEILGRQAKYIANLMAEETESEAEFEAPFAFFYFQTPLGNTGMARVSTIEIEGQMVIRLGTPLGYLLDPVEFYSYQSTSRFAAGWVALKMQEGTKSTFGLKTIEKPLTTKIISQMSGVWVGLSDIHSWIAVSRSLCGDHGEVFGIRNGIEEVLSFTDERIIPSLYAGIEIVWGQDNQQSQELFLKQGINGLSIALDAISTCEGLKEELRIIPITEP